MEQTDATKTVADESTPDEVHPEAAPRDISWESIAAGLCMVTYFLTRPPSVSNGIPYLVDHSVFRFVVDIVLLACSAGLGWWALQNERSHGRIVGTTCLVVSAYLLLDWFHLLLNWRERWWG
jgi:hypothetical protein